MRGRMNRRRSGWQNRKRLVLSALLLAAAPAVGPTTFGLTSGAKLFAADGLLLPPLPLAANAAKENAGPKVNPFCQPVNTESHSTFRLAKSYELPALALTPVAQQSTPVVQLASGGDLHSPDGLTTTIRLLPVTVTPSQESVASAPTAILKSNPHVIVEPIDLPSAELTDKSPVGVDGKAAETDLEPTSAPSLTLPLPTPANVQASSESDTAAKPIDQTDSQVAPPAPTKAAYEGPISFSLDDEDTIETTKRPSAKGSIAAVVRGEEKPLTDHVPKTPEKVQANGKSPAKGSIQFGKPKWPVPKPAENSATIARPVNSAKMILVPLPSADSGSSGGKSGAQEKRIVNGARPRVEVGVLPAAIERANLANSPTVAPVTNVAQPILTPTSSSVFESNSVSPVEMAKTEVRQLSVDGTIRKVQVGDSTVCSVVADGPSQVQLIATRDGMTRIAIWVGDSNAIESKQVFEVRVGSATRTESKDSATLASVLTRSTKTAFPNSDIQVRHENGKMIVEGTCANDDAAKQALRMIRSACLLPVVDKLRIR